MERKHGKPVLRVNIARKTLSIDDKKYSWSTGRTSDGGHVKRIRCWERIHPEPCKEITKPERIEKLDELLEQAIKEHDARQRERLRPAEGFLDGSISDPVTYSKHQRSARNDSDEPERKRKTPEIRVTGQARNGRIFLYDAIPNKNGKPDKDGKLYYCTLGLENNAESKCIKAEIMVSGRRVTHFWGQNEMALLLGKTLKLFKKRWGKKRLKRLVAEILSPNSRGEI